MLTARQFKLLVFMDKRKLWKRHEQMRCLCFAPRRGTGWIFEWLLKAQPVDDAHHAPCCPANHWHRQRIVFQKCTCGAARAATPPKATP